MDERQELNAGRSAMIVLSVVMFGAVAVLAWEYIRTQEVTNTAAIVVLLGTGGLFLLLQRMHGAEVPRSALGHELPTGSTPQEKSERRRTYAIDAAMFAIALTALTLAGIYLVGDTSSLDILPVGGTAGIGLLVALELIGGGLIFYAFNWVMGESAARSVEKRLRKLEA
ncbi:hypothetical protein [Kocuria atrinae]|uniref:hypothetical protein n=1 Tax=Kocuria atrinae TaxID=592377 RepID=UPI00035E8EBA|nr:hypothetical protein [Kocuria atrinae]